MRVGPFLDRFWRRPPTREGRNEQKKAAAAIFNAMAIALLISGLFGPAVNPALEAALSSAERMLLVLGGVGAHIGTRTLLWTLEDRS